MFKIEKNVPSPTTDGKSKYPFGEMSIGDSFFVSDYDSITHGRLRSAAQSYGKKNSMKFTVRKVDGGIRVWRIG